jgi:two-component system chemotaxis sensor kinase CheA
VIEESELRELFAAETEAALQGMESGLLALERTPRDRALLDSVFRQAHALKGSAATLALPALETLAHQFEEILDKARQGRQPLTSERADQLCRTLDALRRLVDEQVSGRPAQVDLRSVLQSLSDPAPRAGL